MGPHLFRHGKAQYLANRADLFRLQWGHTFSGMGRACLPRFDPEECPYRVIRTQNHGLATAIYSIVNVRTRLTQEILRAVPS